MSRVRLIQSDRYSWSEHQKLLPYLPIPPLKETIQGYLRSVKHLLTPEEYVTTERIANNFLSHEGEILHAELLERNRQSILSNQNTSYVRPFWNDMYLCGRYPTPINSNPFFVLEWDVRNTTQAKRAASLVCAFTQFYFAMRENRLPPDIAGTQLQCMDEYSRLFACSRIPMSGKDQWRVSSNSDHIVILRGEDIYAMKIIADDGVIPENKLSQILGTLIMSTMDRNRENPLLLGNLCAWSRNEWALTRSKIAITNADNLDLVDTALFVLCLDYINPGKSLDTQCNIALHGSGQHRWYDKTFNLSVAPNASASVNFEHSMYDGAAIRRLLDETWLMMRGMDTGRPKFKWKWSSNLNCWNNPSKLNWHFSPNVLEDIHAATIFNDRNTNSVSVSVLDFVTFGKNKIKTFKCSPDGLVQVCLQWAYYRLHNKLPGFCYEPASTKRFLCGRTEVVRASTKSSTKFVTYMVQNQNNIDEEIAIKLLQNACSEHRKNANRSANGKGVDRHLFSLFKISQLRTHKTPAFYTDKAWEVSNTSVISTSNVTSEMIRFVGFGAVVPNGYGIAYGILNDTINLTASNFTQVFNNAGDGFGGIIRETKEYKIDTNSHQFCEMVGSCLLEIEDLFH